MNTDMTEANPIRASFIEHWGYIQGEVGVWADGKGWWDNERNDGELIALMHSELSEALEALRHGNPPDDKVPQFNGLTAELADTVIRIMDFCYHRNLPIADAIIAKIAYNHGRERRHGKLF